MCKEPKFYVCKHCGKHGEYVPGYWGTHDLAAVSR